MYAFMSLVACSKPTHLGLLFRQRLRRKHLNSRQKCVEFFFIGKRPVGACVRAWGGVILAWVYECVCARVRVTVVLNKERC